MVPFIQFVLLYVLRVLLAVPSMHSLPELLFSNAAAMELVGFNAHQVKNGVCKRGKKKAEKTGPICDDALSRNIVKIPLDVLAAFFNGVVRRIAQQGLLPKEIWVSLDGSDLPTTPSYEGCGKVTRKKKIKNKLGVWQAVEYTEYGFKLLAVFYGRFRIPLAIKVVQIQKPEVESFLELIDQAQKNLEPGGIRIVGVVVDRAYLSGEHLWQIHQRGIHFVIPARSNMDVGKDAHGVAALDSGLQRYEAGRTRKVRRGIGRKARMVEVETKIVGISGLTTYAQYGQAGFEQEGQKKDGQSHPINAVVVLKWEGRNYGPDHGAVFLTDLPVSKPFVAFDHYDDRSVIENGLFKEGKGPWKLKRFPQKTEQAVRVHVFFTLAVMALTNTFRWLKQKEEAEQLKRQKEDLWAGIEEFRRKRRRKSRDQAIVFVDDAYGIYYLAELFVLMGRKVKDLPAGFNSSEDILRKHGIETAAPPPPPS